MIRVELTSRIPEMLRRAFAVATSGRPGPVLIDVPEDVCHTSTIFSADDFAIEPATLASPARRSRPAAADIERAAALLKKAQRPTILAGGGIHLSGAWHALQALAEALGAPVAHTLSGKGSIACSHPLSMGLFGRYSRIANDVVAASDCLLVVGCKLGEIATKLVLVDPGFRHRGSNFGLDFLAVDLRPGQLFPSLGDRAADLGLLLGREVAPILLPAVNDQLAIAFDIQVGDGGRRGRFGRFRRRGGLCRLGDHRTTLTCAGLAGVAGATGTGKTVTLQTLAENFSRIGVPVFMADVKGDLTGITQAGRMPEKMAKVVQERKVLVGERTLAAEQNQDEARLPARARDRGAQEGAEAVSGEELANGVVEALVIGERSRSEDVALGGHLGKGRPGQPFLERWAER